MLGVTGIGDVLDVSAFGLASGAAVIAAAADVGINVEIALDGDDSVTLLGISKADLDPDDFLI